MFSWFRNRRRNIFRYWDGQRQRGVDPLVAWRHLWENGHCNPADDFGPATGDPPYKYESAARDRVLTMAREMFGVRAWSETQPGLTIDETLTLLWDFITYMDRLKKKQEQSPTSSPPTASSSSAETSATTQPSSESSSIKSESNGESHSSSSKRSVQL